MPSLIGLVNDYIFTGVTGNTAYDIIKAAWTKARQKSWEELYLEAFQGAVDDLRPQLSRYIEDGELAGDRAALSKALHQDLGAAVDTLPFSTLSSDAFAAAVGKALAARSALVIGGHNLSSDDYAQLVRNLISHAKARFRSAILADEAAFRNAVLSESLANQALVRQVQEYLAHDFAIALDRLDTIEHQITAQSDLMLRIAAALQEPRRTDALTSPGGMPASPNADNRQLVRLFIASPGDVRQERDRLHRVVEELNQPGAFADQNGCIIQILDWRDVMPGMGRPEDVILEQLPVEAWDIFVGMLWKRFGTPSGGRDPDTGRYYNSGTQEEFWLAYRAWQQDQRPHMLIYRRTSPLPDDVDLDQLAQVRAFWKEFDATGKHPGLIQTYRTPSAFERRVRNDLIKALPGLVDLLRGGIMPRGAPPPAIIPEGVRPATAEGTHAAQPAQQAALEESSTATNLYLPPKTYSHLIGRSGELDRAVLAIRDSRGKPMIAIVGLGGIGKTTLAREIMEHALQEQLFAYAVWASAKTERFVGEGAVRTGVSSYTFDDLLADIGRQCGRLDIATMPLEQRRFAVQALLAKQRVLIVMDNLETVPEYDALVDDLFQILGASKLLMTSRHQIRHDYVFTINLGGFPEDEGVTFLREEGAERGVDAVAQAERRQLVEIHEVTGGAPLALKLVVGQLSRQPMRVVLTALREASSKGQDYEFYRFVYQHTWSLLDDRARMALVDMSVFPPIEGGALQDVESVSQLDPADFWPAMDQLVATSLVDKVGAIGHERFALHPLTQYFILADITQEWGDS